MLRQQVERRFSVKQAICCLPWRALNGGACNHSDSESDSYHKKVFDYIVSVTAKDRELTARGIQAIQPQVTSYESLLDSISTVLGFPDTKSLPIERKQNAVREMLQIGRGLLFVDNLETVDDPRIIEFLDNLPVGVRVIVTSRRSKVRVSVLPIELRPLDELEAALFISSLASSSDLAYASKLAKPEKERIGRGCDGIPLAIKWVLLRSKTAPQAIALADSIRQTERRGEELLEFSFRRVFEGMTDSEKLVVEVLSLFQSPVPGETILVGSGHAQSRILDAMDDLVGDSVIQRFFDADRNDYTYSLLPIARSFIYQQVSQQAELERGIRKRLEDWFEARDIRDAEQRLVVREIRQGRKSPETGLLDLAQSAQQRGDVDTAEQLYQQALSRNPKSWKAARLFGEFQRHLRDNIAAALQLYEQAAAHAPRRGGDRGLIYREWGMLLRYSGHPDATEQAIEKFETALVEMPNDHVTIDALARMYDRRGAYQRVIELLHPLESHPNLRTRQMIIPLLYKAYKRVGDLLNEARIRSAYPDFLVPPSRREGELS